jgi:GMP synthase-like glutamine amidotransferase
MSQFLSGALEAGRVPCYQEPFRVKGMKRLPKRVLVVENFPATPPGIVGDALAEAGVTVDRRRADLGAPLPMDPSGHDGIVVLGGGQSALDDADYPYLPVLADLTRAFGEAGKPVLGICLGAQIVARAHGAANILGRPIEFGWREVRATDAGRTDPVISVIGAAVPLFHWHNDTFTLPPGAAHLAASDMTTFQAFRIGRAVYGIQFHFEADRRLVAEWTRDLADIIAESDSTWATRHAAEAARHGPAADAAGAALARAWVRLVG